MRLCIKNKTNFHLKSPPVCCAHIGNVHSNGQYISSATVGGTRFSGRNCPLIDCHPHLLYCLNKSLPSVAISYFSFSATNSSLFQAFSSRISSISTRNSRRSTKSHHTATNFKNPQFSFTSVQFSRIFSRTDFTLVRNSYLWQRQMKYWYENEKWIQTIDSKLKTEVNSYRNLVCMYFYTTSIYLPYLSIDIDFVIRNKWQIDKK